VQISDQRPFQNANFGVVYSGGGGLHNSDSFHFAYKRAGGGSNPPFFIIPNPPIAKHKYPKDIPFPPVPSPYPSTVTHHRLELNTFNRILVIAPILGQRKRGPFSRGCISLKNWSYRPLLRECTSPFKSTCLLIKLK
jgi:hypothetical protein